MRHGSYRPSLVGWVKPAPELWRWRLTVAIAAIFLCSGSAPADRATYTDKPLQSDAPPGSPPDSSSAPCDCGPPEFLARLNARPKKDSPARIAAWTKDTLARATLTELSVDKTALVGACQGGDCSARNAAAAWAIDNVIESRLAASRSVNPARGLPATAPLIERGVEHDPSAAEIAGLSQFGRGFVASIIHWSGTYEDLAPSVASRLSMADRKHLEFAEAALNGVCSAHPTCPENIAIARDEVRYLVASWDERRQNRLLTSTNLAVLLAAFVALFGSLGAAVISSIDARKTSGRLMLLLEVMSKTLSIVAQRDAGDAQPVKSAESPKAMLSSEPSK